MHIQVQSSQSQSVWYTPPPQHWNWPQQQPHTYQQPYWQGGHPSWHGHQPQPQHYQQPQYAYNMHPQQQPPQVRQPHPSDPSLVGKEQQKSAAGLPNEKAPDTTTQHGQREIKPKSKKAKGHAQTEDKNSQNDGDEQISCMVRAWVRVKQVFISDSEGGKKDTEEVDEEGNTSDVEQGASRRTGTQSVTVSRRGKSGKTLEKEISDVSEISLSDEHDNNTGNKNKSRKSSQDRNAETSNEKVSGGRKIWNFIKEKWKQIFSIVLIILDIIFDWIEYSEMSSEGEWSTSNKKDTISCSARGDSIAEKFIAFSILGTLFAIVQIANTIYQIYTEKKKGKSKNLMDGRTEVVITRLLEEIPQILLIIAFRAECDITCGKYRAKDLKSALSATFSVVNSTWRHIVSSPTKKSKDKPALRCCCPCCFCKWRCYPRGWIYSCEFCKSTSQKWGCESDFLICISRCYPTHLDPPKAEYIECGTCTKRSPHTNCLTKRFMGPLMAVHIFVYVVYVFNLICGVDEMLGVDVVVKALF